MVNFVTGTTFLEQQIMDSSKFLFFYHFWKEKKKLNREMESELLSRPIGIAFHTLLILSIIVIIRSDDAFRRTLENIKNSRVSSEFV